MKTVATASRLTLASVALALLASNPALAAKSYRFVIETTLPDCRRKCDVGTLKSVDKMSKAECEKALRVAKPIARKSGLKIKSAKCVVAR